MIKMSKNIVICYDGTNAEYGSHNTNVVKTFEAIIRDDNQIAFYDPGVGTFSFFGRTIGRKIGILLGMLFGYGIRRNIEDGYEYLMNTYQTGDRVYIFGFSRGAYTARALAGMLHQFGVLQKGSKNLIPYVSKMYFKKARRKNLSVIKEFKKTFAHPCDPYMIGLWDTVGALGPNLSKKFPDLKLNPDIKYGFQAISIDEKRKPFNVVLWDETSKTKDQVIEQVWFSGVHSEVGGGCSKNDCSLSDIAFAWMMDKASGCYLKLRDNWGAGLNKNPGSEMHDPCTWPWIILGLRRKRKIPRGARIHQSAADRIKNKDGYTPVLPKDTAVVSNGSYGTE